MAESQNNPPRTRILPPPSRRRDKPQLSCNICRKRKLKCDRGQPCEACKRRGLERSCTYVTSNLPTPTKGVAVRSTTRSKHLQDRINHLEQLVTSVANNPYGSQSTSNISTKIKNSAQPGLPSVLERKSDGLQHRNSFQMPHPLGSLGRISLSRNETTYVEGSHWTAILDRIAALKDDSHESGQPIDPQIIHDSGKPDILFGTYNNPNSHQVLADIPQKEVSDRLVDEYFSHKAIAPVVIHSTTFWRQYERFWVEPDETPIIWVGQLFAVMCLARCYQEQQTTKDYEDNRPIQSYRERICQCLVLGKYMKCPPHTIETLLLFLQLEHIRSKDTQRGNRILLGTIVQLALQAGYHRDASNFPEISVFDREMRRRVWATIVQFDILASVQVGLPIMIKESQCDTAEPLNLLDEEIDDNIAALPVPKPDSIETPIQYLLAKNRIAKIYSKISDLTASIRLPPYTEVMELDKILNEIYSSNPQALQMLPMAKSLIDTPNIIMRRIDIAILYQRAKCILHRIYVLSGKTDKQYAYSRSTCIEAALQILECHWILNHETHAGGRLYMERWKVSSLDKSSFYLAATLLCLVLDDDTTPDSERDVADSDLRQRMVQTLHISYRIWILESNSSKDAQKMATALKVVLEKAKNDSLRESLGRGVIADNSQPSNIEPSSSSAEHQSRMAAVSDPSQNPMSIHVLMRLNAGANIDYSEIQIPERPSNLTASQDDLSDTSLGFPRMHAMANDGVRKMFGGTREG